jgi:acetyl esterase/lipase
MNKNIVLYGLVCSLWFGCCGRLARAQDAGYRVLADVVYGHKDGLALTYDVFQPTQERLGVGLLFMVSGGWVSSWSPPDKMLALIKPLLERGYTVIAVRHGSSPRYVIPEIAVDVRQALEHVSTHASDYQIDADRLGVFGYSAGGHLSLLLGTQTNDRGTAEQAPRVRAVVAVFPPTDLAPYVDPASPLRERFPALKFDPSESDKYSPLKHVTADDAPTLLVHGDQDELVPIWHSQKLAAALESVSVPHQLLTIEGAAHGFDAAGNRRMFEAMLSWFDKHLQTK